MGIFLSNYYLRQKIKANFYTMAINHLRSQLTLLNESRTQFLRDDFLDYYN